VFLHNPPYTCAPLPAHTSDMDVRGILCPLFEQYGVNMVFTGHNHEYERNYANGVYYIVTGGGGAPLHPSLATCSYSIYAKRTYECCQLSVSNNVLDFQTIEPDGTVIDSFSLTAPAVPVGFSRFSPE
jgi:acid phosphatase type 7